MKFPELKILSDKEINQIHEASLKILSQTGMLIYSRQVLEMLESAGAEVDLQKQIAKFPPELIEKSLKTLPAEIILCDRQGNPGLSIGRGAGYVASGHNAIFILDINTGQRRPATKKDITDFAKLSDCLDNIDVVGIQAMPQDVEAKASLLHAIEASLDNTNKHIFFSPESSQVTEAAIKMAQVVTGKEDLLGCSPMTCQLSSTSPLFWETGAVESVVKISRSGIPCSFLPHPYTGVTAPITLAGLLTMNNAEFLSGAVISQLSRKGAPVIYGTGWTTFDMKNSAVLISTPEATLCRIAGVQLARFYNVPSHTIGPDSDAHLHDEQNGWEKITSTLSGLGAGVDLLVNAGMFDTGLTVSFEQLVIDDEIVGWVRRYLEGIEVTDQTIAIDVINRVGPKGNFLCDDHTLKYLRSKEHWEASLSDRHGFEMWMKKGGADIVKTAKLKAQEILNTHQPQGLEQEVQGNLRQIIKTFEKDSKRKL